MNYTEPDMPPVNVMARATSPRSISVLWREVVSINRNGIITMYEVQYEPLETFGGQIQAQTMNVTSLEADLRDLEEFVNYTITVQAYTSVGKGPDSMEITVMTPPDGKNLRTTSACIHCYYFVHSAFSSTSKY